MNNDNFLIINDFSQILIDVYSENSVAFIQTVWDAVNGFDVDWIKYPHNNKIGRFNE